MVSDWFNPAPGISISLLTTLVPSRMESTKRKIVFELILDGHLSKNDATATTTQEGKYGEGGFVS